MDSTYGAFSPDRIYTSFPFFIGVLTIIAVKRSEWGDILSSTSLVLLQQINGASFMYFVALCKSQVKQKHRAFWNLRHKATSAMALATRSWNNIWRYFNPYFDIPTGNRKPKNSKIYKHIFKIKNKMGVIGAL